MSMTRAMLFLAIVVTPTVIGVVILTAPRWLTALGEYVPDRHAARGPQPTRPPIQQLAADLRRLIRLHGELSASAQLATRAHRLWSVEAAISARAVEAAQALEIAYEDPTASGGVDRHRLSALLHALCRAGLVLPERVGPFTADGRL
jgi:hypothetical protein